MTANAAMALTDADARQWQRLRQLRVQRAREAVAAALAAERQARAVLDAREAAVAQGRERLGALARHWGGAGCTGMPRWAGQVRAHQEALAERLERDEYALLDEQDALARAQQALRERRAELVRAQARESAVDATLQDRRRHTLLARDRQAELAAEDACRPHGNPR